MRDVQKILDVSVSDTALRVEHARIVRALLGRGPSNPAREEGDILPTNTYHPEAIRLARENWRERMVHEHASSVVFSGVLPQLMAAGASLDVKTTLLRCALDELHHAGLCAQVVEFLGGEAPAPADLDIPDPPRHEDCSARVSALRNVLFASLSETISVALLTAEREVVAEPFLERVLRQLSGDEILHARVGWIFLAQMLPKLSGQELSSLEAYLPIALEHLQACMLEAMPMSASPPEEQILDDAMALGFSYSGHTRELFFDTMDAVVVPQLGAFGLDAASAWEEVSRR